MNTHKKYKQKCIFVPAFWVIFSMCLIFKFTSAQAHLNPNAPLREVEDDFVDFETHLEIIRQTLKIPGMSAAVVRDQELIWGSGFGYADLENQVPATPDTPYGLASVTKPVAAFLIMQLVEEGLIDLDAPVSQYGVNLVGDVVTVRHLMTHTSEGVPGTQHNYNGSRYGHLGGVIEGATGKSFAENLSKRVLLPLDMTSSALNPINFWGGSNLSGLRDIQPALGWGSAFQHYPDVYAQLAKPYQFDAQYNPIPGMYHLYHNPAAGLISTVSDLAKFDIALDQGLLLGETAKEEMFSPAYSTYGNRGDLMYGLGWYVQDFDDLQLLWHTGRWPPSTSALYLKIPSQDLTFIVLANTANLTTPFDGIGYGDISKSLLMLSFYRHFVFPERYGMELPLIDWGAAEGILVNQLSDVEDQPTREYLERELWAFRQAYASVGQKDQVEKLRRVNLRAFPNSTMRKYGFFTYTVGGFPVIQSGWSAVAFMRLSWGIFVWVILVILSLIWITVSLIRRSNIARRWWFYWMLSTIFLGPIPIIVYEQIRSPLGISSLSKREQAMILSTFQVGIYAVGWALAFSLLMRFGSEPHPLAILGVTYLTPISVSLVVFRIPSLLIWGKGSFKKRLPEGLWAEVISMNITFAVMFPLTMVLDQLFSTIPGSFNPFYWAMLSFLSLLNLIAQYPINAWMIQRGLKSWQPKKLPEKKNIHPDRKSAWPVLVTSLLILISSLVITISQLA